MTRQARKALVVVLFVVAAVAGIAGIAVWQNANEDAQNDQLANDFEVAFGLDERDTSPDHTPSYVLFVLAGLAAMSAVIFLATMPVSEPNDPARKRRFDSDEGGGWG